MTVQRNYFSLTGIVVFDFFRMKKTTNPFFQYLFGFRNVV